MLAQHDGEEPFAFSSLRLSPATAVPVNPPPLFTATEEKCKQSNRKYPSRLGDGGEQESPNLPTGHLHLTDDLAGIVERKSVSEHGARDGIGQQ